MRIVTDLEHAAELTDWLEPVLKYREPPWLAASLFPRAFPAYAKAFHGMFEDPDHAGSDRTWEQEEGAAEQREWQEGLGLTLPGELVRAGSDEVDIEGARRVWWRDIVDERLLDARANWRTLGRSFDEVSWPRRIVGPDEGRLDPVSLAGLVRCFVDAGAEQSCAMFLEDWVALMNGLEDQCAGQLGFVVLGDVQEVHRFDAATGRTPQWWWAVDGSWMVHTDVDSCVTWVSGAVELIERVEAEPWLEARRFEGEAIAFPDRREDASPPTSSSQDARRVLGLRPFLRGFAWWVASMVIGSGVLIAAPDALVAVILSLGVFAYGLYRLARGLVGSVGSVPVDRRRD